MKAFKPYRHRTGTMKYYQVPLGVLESPIELVAWARRSIAAAQSAEASTPAARPRVRPNR